MSEIKLWNVSTFEGRAKFGSANKQQTQEKPYSFSQLFSCLEDFNSIQFWANYHS